jgi:hypothetical protein
VVEVVEVIEVIEVKSGLGTREGRKESGVMPLRDSDMDGPIVRSYSELELLVLVLSFHDGLSR